MILYQMKNHYQKIQKMKEESNDQKFTSFDTNSNNKISRNLTRNFTEHKPKRYTNSNDKEKEKKSQKTFSRHYSQEKQFRRNDLDHKHTEEKPIIVVDREIEIITEIMKYMLGEYNNEKPASYTDERKTCEDWEIEEIMKQVSDTNLGDFIIKCPNPDNVPEELENIYGKPDPKADPPVKPFSLNASQAMEFYYDLFDIEVASKLDSEREHVAFLLAFHFLKYGNTLEEYDEISDTFIKIFNFYKLVETKSLLDYAAMRQEEGFYEKYQYIIDDLFKTDYSAVQGFKEGRSYAAEDDRAWRALKRAIFWNMNTHIVREFTADSENCRNILGKVKSIAQLLKTFPELMEKALEKVKSGSETDFRVLFGGQYLKKTIVGENVIWVNTKNRPNDVATLLRMSILYKLVVRSKLFVRSFLSKDEKHIMLVIKTSEEILENYAQKYKISMEVDLGASDLFSFEPVDYYLRPLRLHNYITDIDFREKYDIKGPQKNNPQEEEKYQSIESEALTIYKKAQLMNEEQLRTLIILDQFEVDKAYHWISNKLKIDYFKNKVLDNDYNTIQPSRQTWELFYVYNKMIIVFTKRCQQLYNVNKKAKEYLYELDGNIGMILRLMFLKALQMCNDMFYNHREARSIIPRSLSNVWTDKNKLKNIWNHMGIDSPSGFCTYRRTKTNERLWRKFEINELKDRSKFFPSERLIITNKVIYDSLNISKSLEKLHIINYYPLHDPYVLKNIEISPYIASIKALRKTETKQVDGPDPAVINKLYSQYECELTKSDFTKMSIEEKLAFECTSFKSFSADSVRYYCGEKIAFYFEFMKFLALQAFPFILPALIMQILLWKQQTDILKEGTSALTTFNNILFFIFTFANLIWVTHLIQKWKKQQRKIAQLYGVTELTEVQQKRVKYTGQLTRNFETDELNFEYSPQWRQTLKTIFTIILNLAYVLLVAQTVLLLFLFKTYLFELGLPQSLVNNVPSISITIATQIYTQIYTYIIKNITIFENHKKVSEFEGSLITKASLITFVINFNSIFIFAFFSNFLSSSYICQIKPTSTLKKITNCDYFVSNQLLTSVMIDVALSLVGAILPLALFKLRQWLSSRKKSKTSKMNRNFFESIDQFYQQQDKMESYMYNQELDNSWDGYMSIISVFTATALFGPALPFSYVMMFFAGILKLHSSKYAVIFLTRRILPIKANSINWWLPIIQAISFLSIFTNIGYMIYTRGVFKKKRAVLFLFFIILFFAFKYYLLSQYSQENNQMAKRNQIKTIDLLLGKGQHKYSNIPAQINTDVQNIYYDEARLNRKFHHIKTANLKFKQKAV